MAEYKGKLLPVPFSIKDTGWQTINSNLQYRKIGNIVYVKLITGYTITADSWTSVGFLPEGYRPDNEIFDCPYYSNSSFCAVRINSNGNVRLNGDNSLSFQTSFVLG